MLRVISGRSRLFPGFRIWFGMITITMLLIVFSQSLMAKEEGKKGLGQLLSTSEDQNTPEMTMGKTLPAGDESSEEEVSGSDESEPAEAPKEKPTIEELKKEYPNGWKTIVEPGGEIFPSLVIAVANIPKPPDQPCPEGGKIIGDEDGWLGALVISPKAGAKVKLKVTCPDLMNESVLEAVLPDKDTVYNLFPNILWKFEVLRGIRQTVPANIVFDLTVDEKKFPQAVQRARVRTINDCPYYDADPEDPVDMTWMFSVYVNEDHPIVDQILKEALQTNVVEGFTGYQDEDSLEVYRQVFAIWTAIRKRKVKYSSITTTAANSERVYSQHVRFLDESLAATQANCVDGSVLFASVLRKIGIEPILVVLPSHCFLGFYLDENQKKKAFLETTCIGSSDPDDVKVLTKLEKTLSEKVASGKAWMSFKEAIKTGRDQYKENSAEFKKNSGDYQLVRIARARKAGFMPIARP